MTLSGLLLYIGVYFVAVASPGPGIALVLARAMGKGLDRVGWFVAGFALGDTVLFILAASGLAIIAQTFENVFLVIRYLGAAYLIYLAVKIWRAPATAIDITAETLRETPVQAFLSSFLLTLGNPKPIMFFLSIMPLVVDLTSLTAETFLILGLANIVVIAPVMLAYALLADRTRRLFRSEGALRTINRTTAGVMAGAAVAIAAR